MFLSMHRNYLGYTPSGKTPKRCPPPKNSNGLIVKNSYVINSTESMQTFSFFTFRSILELIIKEKPVTLYRCNYRCDY